MELTLYEFAGVLAVAFIGAVVLVPLLALAVRFALRPLIQALIAYRWGPDGTYLPWTPELHDGGEIDARLRRIEAALGISGPAPADDESASRTPVLGLRRRA